MYSGFNPGYHPERRKAMAILQSAFRQPARSPARSD